MDCAINSLVKPKSYNVGTSQEPPPQLIWISLNHQNWAWVLSHTLWEFWLPCKTLQSGGCGVYGLSQTGRLLLVTCWLLISHGSDPELFRNIQVLTPSLLWAEPLPVLCFFFSEPEPMAYADFASRRKHNSYTPLSNFQQLAGPACHCLSRNYHFSLCCSPSINRCFPFCSCFPF